MQKNSPSSQYELDSSNLPQNNSTVQFGKDILSVIFSFLNKQNVLKVRRASKFWKEVADTTTFGKQMVADRWLYLAVVNSQTLEVRKSLKEGANVNTLINFKCFDLHAATDFKKGNFLHFIICQRSLNLQLRRSQADIEIFKILLQHGIDVNHQVTGSLYRGITDVHVESNTPLQLLRAEFQDMRLASLLQLRLAELKFIQDKNLNEFVAIILNLRLDETIVREYLLNIQENDKGLFDKFGPQEKEQLFQNKSINDFVKKDLSMCLVM